MHWRALRNPVMLLAAAALITALPAPVFGNEVTQNPGPGETAVSYTPGADTTNPPDGVPDSITFHTSEGDVVQQLTAGQFTSGTAPEFSFTHNGVTMSVVVATGTAGADNAEGMRTVDHPIIFFGGKGPDRFMGGSHGDSAHGGEGDDDFDGGADGDKIWGGSGTDNIWGRAGNDTMYGEGDTDHIYDSEGPDRDVVYLGDGADTVDLADGDANDSVDCGGSDGATDTGQVDQSDNVSGTSQGDNIQRV